MNSIHIKHFLVPPSTNVSRFLAQENQLTICSGVNPSYKLGELIKDTGYQQIGSTLESGKSITGLFNFRQSANLQQMLATVNDSTDDNTQLFYSTGGAWTEIAAAETAWANKANINMDFESFIGFCFFVGYGDTDGFISPRTLTNTTTFGTTNTTNMPNAKYIKRFGDRLYIANCDITGTAYPYRVYYSSVPSSGSISWTTSTDFFDVDYSEEITGLGALTSFLAIFTQYNVYLYTRDRLVPTEWEVGCSEYRTIQNVDSMLVWCNQDNVWATTGGRPTPIGNDILELLNNSTSSNWRSAVVDREYHLYLGNTSANGISYSNCLATYNIRTGMWRWRELADGITAMAKRWNTSLLDDYLQFGTASGDVMEKGKYTDSTVLTSDNGSEISSHFRTKAYDFGDPSIKKEIMRTVAYAERGQMLQIGYRLSDRNSQVLGKFENLGTLKNVVSVFDKKPLDGYFIEFEGKERSTLPPWKFLGFSALIKGDDKLK